jgi:hypothetical protein
MVGRKFVVSGRDTPTLLDLVEEPFDQVARTIQMRAEVDRVFAMSFRRNVRPCSLLAGKLPEPVRVVSRRRSCQRSCISSRPGTGERNLRIFVALRWRPKSTYFFAILLRAGSGRTDIGGTCGSRPASSGWPLSQNFRYNLVCRSVAARSMPRVGLKTKLRLAG